jgi:hypothetical protein
MRPALKAAAFAVAISGFIGVPAANAGGPVCRIVTDPAGDASLRSFGAVATPNEPALDVVSADIASGPRNLTVVVRVDHLGAAADAGPRLDQWTAYFTVRGHGFAATAARAIDGQQFYLAGDFPEQSAAPGFTAAVPVTGAFLEATNEIRVVVPRDLVGRTRKGDRISQITVDTVTGVGTLATQATGAYAGTTVDRTAQPGPTTAIGARSCVRST